MDDSDFINGLINAKATWIDEFQDIDDPRVKWEIIKYKIRQFCVAYSVKKSKEKKSKEGLLTQNLKILYDTLDTTQEQNEREKVLQSTDSLKEQLEELDDVKTEGCMLRSKTRWFEYGEKNSQYFLNLEKYNGSVKCISKLKSETGVTVTDPKEILRMQKNFYKDLYKKQEIKSVEEAREYLNKIELPK